MTIDEFVRMAAAQSVVNEQRIVDVWGPELKALVAERKAMTFSEISTHPDQRKETRTFRRGHVLGPGLRADAIESWQRKWPSHVLPPDLAQLLSRVNGIHLWADLDSQKAYFGILPLEEWQHASQSRLSRLTTLFQDQSRGQLVISNHKNGDYYLVLDTKKPAYFWFDTQDLRNPALVARNVEELLSWWWNHAAELAPETLKSR